MVRHRTHYVPTVGCSTCCFHVSFIKIKKKENLKNFSDTGGSVLLGQLRERRGRLDMDVANKNSDTSSFKPSFNYKLTSDYFNTNKYKYNLCICYFELQFSAGTGSV